MAGFADPAARCACCVLALAVLADAADNARRSFALALVSGFTACLRPKQPLALERSPAA